MAGADVKARQRVGHLGVASTSLLGSEGEVRYITVYHIIFHYSIADCSILHEYSTV